MLAASLFVFPRGGDHIQQKTQNTAPPAAVELAAGWKVRPTGGASYRVVKPALIRLDRGELYIESAANLPAGRERPELIVETPAGTATAAGTKFFIGTHQPLSPTPLESKGAATMRSITRVLVLAGVVTLTNVQGSVTGTADHLLAAEAGKAPVNYAVTANSDFAWNLYKQLSREKSGKNLFFSPYSISSALAMTAEGARGDTAAQMGRTLCFPAAAARMGTEAQLIPWNVALIHTGMSELNQRFNAPKLPYQLHVANALWGEKTHPFLQSYVDAIHKYYRTGGIFPVDFRGNPEAVRQRINQWVEQQTAERIKNLIAEGQIDASTQLVLTNAIYFKAAWLKLFDNGKYPESGFQRLCHQKDENADDVPGG